MITRIWKGWTTLSNAPIYESLLLTEIFAGIAARDIPGYRGISLCKRQAGDEMEFVTIMKFDSLEAVREFAGEDYAAAVVRAGLSVSGGGRLRRCAFSKLAWGSDRGRHQQYLY